MAITFLAELEGKALEVGEQFFLAPTPGKVDLNSIVLAFLSHPLKNIWSRWLANLGHYGGSL